MIDANLIHAAQAASVAKLLFLGSSCIYPREASQPIREELLLTGPLEATNERYAVAKIAGIKLCQAYCKQHGSDFIAAMPSKLYGPNDYYHPTRSHGSRRFSRGSMRRATAAPRSSLAVGPVARGVNSSTSTISPTPACSCSNVIPAPST